MMDFVWVGPIISPKSVGDFKCISPAANEWQIQFLEAAKKKELSYKVLTYLPQQMWPKGNLLSKYPKNQDVSFLKFEGVDFLNFPKIREFIIAIKLFLIFARSPRDLIITYNPLLRHIFFVQLAKFFYSPKWISIIADDLVKGKPDISVFLSIDYYNRFIGRKIFFEGGILKRNFKSNINAKNLIFAGSISKWTGIIEFVKMMDSIPLKTLDIELHIYGIGDITEIREIIERNNSIKYFGYVNDEILELACQKCLGFVNPRPFEVINGDNNFPSKLLYYFGYNKPVISTITRNIPDSYKNFLIPYSDQSSLLESIEFLKIKGLDKDYHKLLNNFIDENIWEKKVERLMLKINHEINL